MMRRFLFAILVCAGTAVGQWQSIGSVDSVTLKNSQEIELMSGHSVVQISVLAGDLVRVHVAPDGKFDNNKSVAVSSHRWPTVRTRFVPTRDDITFSTDEMTVRIARRPLRISFLDPTGHVMNTDDSRKGMAWDSGEVRVWKRKQPGENFFGLGEKAGSLNRIDKAYAMWNSDIPAYKADTDPLYQSVPFYYGLKNGKAYGVFFDNTYWSSFDFGKESRDLVSFGATGGEIDYYYFAGPSPKKIVERFSELVGRMPLPPRWSLGYQQSRWSYSPESRVRTLAQTFREKKIPCDVIYLDIDYMEGYRIFTFSSKNFPHPEKMISDLRNDGFKIAVIIDPGIKADSTYRAFRSGLRENVFLKYPDGRLFVGKVWPGECAFPDFSKPTTRAWWGKNFQTLTQAGVRGFWNDMNEPSVFDSPNKTVDLEVTHDDNGMNTTQAKNHNTYGLQMTQATYEGVRALRPDERPFVLTRASFAGGWRWSAAWTGDNVSSWQHLQMAVPMCLSISVSGQPFVGTDIGGFMGAPDGELFARWLQLGVFTPLMRAHAEINSPNKEPWAFGEKFEDLNRRTIELRYRLLPYIYTVMQQASESGIPAMRPLWFEFPDEDNFIWNEDEFMFGDDILVAPVLWAQRTQRDVRLPNGVWYDFWTDQKYEGGKTVTVDAPIDRIPFFVRAGAVIPMQQVVQYIGQAPVDPLTLIAYPGPSMSSALYEDDGLTFQYQNGSFLHRTVEQSIGDSIRCIRISPSEGTFQPSTRRLVIRAADVVGKPAGVTLNGRNLQELSEVKSSDEGWKYDPTRRRVDISITDMREEMTIVVRTRQLSHK